MLAFIVANKVVLLGALLAVSEALALVPAVQSNSIFQLVVNSLKKLKEWVAPAQIESK